jgi:hypothetical protein
MTVIGTTCYTGTSESSAHDRPYLRGLALRSQKMQRLLLLRRRKVEPRFSINRSVWQDEQKNFPYAAVISTCRARR